MGGDPRARLPAPNRARRRWGHPQLPQPPPHPLQTLPVRLLLGCQRSPSRRVGHSPWGPGWPCASAQRRGRRRWRPAPARCRGPMLRLPWGSTRAGAVPPVGPGTGSLCHRVTEPAAAPLLGLAGGKSCLCFSNICLLFCICRFFKDREPPLPRFLRRYPQQCRPRSPPHSKKTNVRPRIDMK